MTVETLANWILGTATPIVAGGIAAYISVTNRLTRLESMVHEDMESRVTRMETLMKMLGDKAAKILHSPSDHHQMDELLDKYLDRHYELSPEEWTELLIKTSAVENDKSLTKGERTLAAWLNAICHHKLMMDPPEKKHLE